MKSFFSGVVSGVISGIILAVLFACTSYYQAENDIAMSGVFDTDLGKSYLLITSMQQNHDAIVDTFLYFKKNAEVHVTNFSGASRNLYSLVASHNVRSYVSKHFYDKLLPVVFQAVYPIKNDENPVYVYIWLSKSTNQEEKNMLDTTVRVERTNVRILIDRGNFQNSRTNFQLPYDENQFIEEVKKRI